MRCRASGRAPRRGLGWGGTEETLLRTAEGSETNGHLGVIRTSRMPDGVPRPAVEKMRGDVTSLDLGRAGDLLGRLLRGTGASAVILMALTLPYARPIVCSASGHDVIHAPGHGEHRGNEIQRAGHASAGPRGAVDESCHESMDCCVVPAAPTIDRANRATPFQHPWRDSPAPARTPSSQTISPLTPPPRA